MFLIFRPFRPNNHSIFIFNHAFQTKIKIAGFACPMLKFVTFRELLHLGGAAFVQVDGVAHPVASITVLLQSVAMASYVLAVGDESLLDQTAGLAHVSLTGRAVEEDVVFVDILGGCFWVGAAVAAHSAVYVRIGLLIFHSMAF